MNQRTLVVLTITTGANSLTGAATTSASFDLAQDNVTTSTWTYANIGRREMKLCGYLFNAFTGTSNCTAFTGYLISGTTGAAAGTWTPIANSTFGGSVTQNASNFTSAGGVWQLPESYFVSNQRYIRAIWNVQGATTASVIPAVFILEEQRAS